MNTLWIGLREEDFLCASEHGRDTIARMRDNNSLIRFGSSALQVIRTDGEAIGYGLVVARLSGRPHAIDTDTLTPRLLKVKQAFNIRGVGGRMTINMERTDTLRLPIGVVS